MQDAQPGSVDDALAAQQDVAVAQQDVRPSASHTPKGTPQLHGTTRWACLEGGGKKSLVGPAGPAAGGFGAWLGDGGDACTSAVS